MFLFQQQKKNSNRFEFFICFRNQFFMLQIRLMKKPRVPRTLEWNFCNTILFNQWNSSTQLKKNQNISLSSLLSRVLHYFLYKFCFMSWNPCDTGTNFRAIETFYFCCHRMKTCFRVPLALSFLRETLSTQNF